MSTNRLIADRYEVGALIGRGGMADVYEGTDIRLGRKVAIKLLKADLASDPTFEYNFRQEAQNSARMTHPTIVRIYDTGEEDSVDGNGNHRRTPYIIMEYVKGTVLRDLLHARRLSIAEAVGFTEGILTALEFSHRAGIIHRDIKSANIMVTDSGAAKVMDFGIARAMSDSSATQSHTMGIVGTAQYFSPEQARGETVDARTDLYSTGVLLYEMLAGRAPFIGETAVSVAYQHVSEAVTPPSTFNPQISPALDAVVLHALAKDKNERYQSAESFREHLLSAVLSPSVSAPVAPAPFTDILEGVPAEALEFSEAQPTAVMPVAEADEFDRFLGLIESETSVAVKPVTQPVIEVPQPPTNTNPFAEIGLDLTPVTVETATPKARNGAAGWLWGLGSALTILVIGMLVYVLGFAKVNVPITSNKVVITDVTGKTFEDGSAIISGQGFSVSEVQVASDTVPNDTIIKTDPAGGTSLAKGSEVTITVSTGPTQIAVPTLIGLTEAAAKDALTQAGLTLGTITPGPSPDAPLGQIIDSTPKVGAYANSGTPINLTVSSGKVLVPSVINMGLAQAQNLLGGVSVGFTVVVSTHDAGCTNNPPQGTTVLGQSIAAGQATQHSTITLFVACNAG